MKFYNLGPDDIACADWHCPSCSGFCRCAACSRSSLSKDGGLASDAPIASDASDADAPPQHDQQPDEEAPAAGLPKPGNVSLNEALDLPGQFTNFGHSSPTSSSEGDPSEMLAGPSAGTIVESSLSAGHRLEHAASVPLRRPAKKVRHNPNESAEFSMPS